MKKLIRPFISLPLILGSVALLSACGSSDDDVDSVSAVVATEDLSERSIFALFKDTGDVEPEFIISPTDFDTTDISAQGAGFEQLGWNFSFAVGNRLFITGFENFETQSFIVDQSTGELAPFTSFVFDQTLEMFGAIGDETFLASTAPRDGTNFVRQLYIVDVETGLVNDIVDYEIESVDTGTVGEGSVGWPTALVVRDDQLFIPFHRLSDDGGFATRDASTAAVAIYDWPMTDGATPTSIIEDTRLGHIGVNGAASSMFSTESGDIYGWHNGTLSGGFDPESDTPSGFLRIQNGASEFDADYFFDVEAEGSGGRLFWADYIGNGMALGRVLVNESAPVWFSAFGKDFFEQKLVLIDLEAQTVTDVAGVPLHQKRYTAPLQVINGKVLLSIETADGNNVYEYDVASGVATQGSAILGKTIKGFYDLTP